MKIEEFLSEGHLHPTKRNRLVELTGASDREIRSAIEHSDELILNNGYGYFIYNPVCDDDELCKYIIQETRRLISQREKLANLKAKVEKKRKVTN